MTKKFNLDGEELVSVDNAFKQVSTRFAAVPAVRTHSPRRARFSNLDKMEELPAATLIVGDQIRWLSEVGIEISPMYALAALKRGEKVFFDTWEMAAS